MQKHKIIAAVVALPIAIILWLYVVTVVSPDFTKTIRDIPVEFEGAKILEENGLIMTSGSDTVSLKIKGDRVNVTKLTKKNIRVVADLSRVSFSEPGEYSVQLTVVFPDLSGKSNFEVVERSKSETRITVSNLITKTVPVVLNTGDESAKEGYYFAVEDAIAEPAEIQIVGPDFEVDSISSAVIDCTDISSLEETVVEARPFVLTNEDGTKAECSKTSCSQQVSIVSLPIQKYKELRLSVEILDGGGATKDNVDSIEYSVETVRVRGSVSQIDNLPDELIIGTLDLAKLTSASNTKSFPVSLPGGIKNVTGTETVDVKVKFKGLMTQTFMIPSEKLSILDGVMKITVNSEKIAVKVRGPEADVLALTPDDIGLFIDPANITESGEIPVEVIINGPRSIAVIEPVLADITVE